MAFDDMNIDIDFTKNDDYEMVKKVINAALAESDLRKALDIAMDSKLTSKQQKRVIAKVINKL